jgi:AcrR family transcriptional regulator
MRAVARDLGVVSSALFRYFPTKEDLLGELAADVARELAEAVDAAIEEAGADPLHQWLAGARAARAWALEHRFDFLLVYGYGARPKEPLEGAFFGIAKSLAGILDRARRLGRLRPTAEDHLSAELFADATFVRLGALPNVSEPVVMRALVGAASVLGVLSYELFGHLEGLICSPPQFFELWAQRLAWALGIEDTNARG